ncbi:metallophosphoesterase [Thermococcus sp. Bubb.Bath]|uniref:metallophosphoesterase n=1 Tax=Thermococcus sp. Bubb.Bath TaxID=1638242 RepID=UPI001438830C|nr:metallophosphoesterase [Thermococcus sp. Bubb.Bath]NJF24098.1 exonuclease SbcD [Thermococcus sp. Bubb.Bath]
MESEWIRREFERLSLIFHTSLGKTLVISDPHVGFEFSRGLRLRTHFEEKLASFIQEKDPDLLIILGDIKEPIGLSFAVKTILMEFFSSLKGINVVITKGNHDGRIEEAASPFPNISVLDYLILDGALYLHGHTNLPTVEFGEGYLGHIHPAYTVGSPGKRIKVFVRAGKFLILPTINPYIEGFDVRQGIKMVPFLRGVEELNLFLPEGVYLGKVQL